MASRTVLEQGAWQHEDLPLASSSSWRPGCSSPKGPMAMPDGSILARRDPPGHALPACRPAVARWRSSPTSGAAPTARRSAPTARATSSTTAGSSGASIGGMVIPFDIADMSNEPPDFDGGWVDRVDLATGEHTVLYRECDGGGSAARTTSCSTPTAASGSPTSARSQRPRRRPRLRSSTRTPTAHLVERGAVRLHGPNGVGLSPDGDRVYVAESFTGRAARVGRHRPRA